MSWNEEFIGRYGEAAYEKRLERDQQWHKEWRGANPEKAEEKKHEQHRNGGKGYERHLEYQHSGLQRERNKIRTLHAKNWRPYKMIIAPESVLHHEWRPETSEYSGIALVEADQHMHGIIDVIRILDGEITVFTEKELREQVM